jgi:YesN/AraC family two-component response regulator
MNIRERVSHETELIVEDEQNTADGLAQFLSREVAELQEIHIARDASEGYEKFLRAAS